MYGSCPIPFATKPVAPVMRKFLSFKKSTIPSPLHGAIAEMLLAAILSIFFRQVLVASSTSLDLLSLEIEVASEVHISLFAVIRDNLSEAIVWRQNRSHAFDFLTFPTVQQCRTKNIDLQSDLNDSKGTTHGLLRKIEQDTHLWDAEKSKLEGTVAELRAKHKLMASEMGSLTQNTTKFCGGLYQTYCQNGSLIKTRSILLHPLIKICSVAQRGIETDSNTDKKAKFDSESKS